MKELKSFIQTHRFKQSRNQEISNNFFFKIFLNIDVRIESMWYLKWQQLLYSQLQCLQWAEGLNITIPSSLCSHTNHPTPTPATLILTIKIFDIKPTVDRNFNITIQEGNFKSSQDSISLQIEIWKTKE